MRRMGRGALLALGALVAFMGAATAHAQVGSFGRNKPVLSSAPWKYVQTPHFDIYYRHGMEDIARFATTIAEQAYSQLSTSFDYRLRERIPIVLYRSHNEFTQTLLTPGLVAEGVGGFTEDLKNRVAVPFEGSYPEFRHVLHHELTHAVMHQMLFGRDILTGEEQSDIPLWFEEGTAEYESNPWNSESDMWIRDAVMNDYLQLTGYFVYPGGQALMYYIAEVYGPDKIAQLLHRLQSYHRFAPAMQAVLGIRLDKLAKNWELDLKKVYWPEIVDFDDPDNVGQALTDHTKDNSFFNRNPTFSPYGDKIAFLTGRDYYTSIYVMSAIDGKILWKVVTGEKSGAFEEMHWLRAALTWSPDAKYIAFAAQAADGDRIYIVDARTGHRVHTYNPHLDGVFSPDWSPDGKTMAFVGIKNGKSDLYLLDVASGKTTRLTNDFFDDKDPKWSPNGKELLFSSDRAPGVSDKSAQLLYQTSDIYLMDVATRHLRRLTSNPHDDVSPTWCPDGHHIAFSSDRNGIFNLYVADLDSSDSDGTIESSVRPLTNILTGAFSPDWSRTGDKIAFSAFSKGGWDIHVIRNPLDHLKKGPLRRAFFLREGRVSYASAHSDVQIDSLAAAGNDSVPRYRIGPRMTPIGSPTRNLLVHTMADSARGGFVAKPYHSRLHIDDISGMANYSTLGGVGGQLYLTASDLMGYHQLVFTTSLYRDLRDSDYGLLYQYLRRRTKYSTYFSQVRTWYPFQGIDATGAVTSSGLVEQQQLSLGGYASRPTSQFKRFEFGLEYLRSAQSILYDIQPVSTTSSDQSSTIQAMLVNAAVVHDNSLWNAFGPMLGSRWRITLYGAPPRINTSAFGVITADWRKYIRVTKNTSFAMRISGGSSFAQNSNNAPLFYVGGMEYWINYNYANISSDRLVNDVFSQFVFPARGLDYYELRGRQYAIVNLEYRFPWIYLLATGPFGFVFNNVGGVLFLDMARTWNDPTQPLDPSIPRHSQGPLGGIGYGVRVNLGVVVLRFDVAWKTDLRQIMGGAKYYWSFGYDF